jgi:uncharacterized protein (TIGR02266 family)
MPDPKPSNVIAKYDRASVDELVAEHAQDASEEGIFVRTGCSLPVGKLVDFEIQLSSGEVVLSGAGRIAWKRDEPEGDRPAGVAIKFVDLDDPSRAFVDRLLGARKGDASEYDSPPKSNPARTVLGLGSAFASAGARPAEKARAGTVMGLAPPSIAAGLVLAEPSSPSVETTEPPRPVATSDIDRGWLEESETGDRASGKPREPPSAPGSDRAVAADARRPVAAGDARARPTKTSLWPWLLLLALASAVGVYRFRDRLHDAGLPSIPTIPGLPYWLSGDSPSEPASDEPAPALPTSSAPTASAKPSAPPKTKAAGGRPN